MPAFIPKGTIRGRRLAKEAKALGVKYPSGNLSRRLKFAEAKAARSKGVRHTSMGSATSKHWLIDHGAGQKVMTPTPAVVSKAPKSVKIKGGSPPPIGRRSISRSSGATLPVAPRVSISPPSERKAATPVAPTLKQPTDSNAALKVAAYTAAAVGTAGAVIATKRHMEGGRTVTKITPPKKAATKKVTPKKAATKKAATKKVGKLRRGGKVSQYVRGAQFVAGLRKRVGAKLSAATAGFATRFKNWNRPSVTAATKPVPKKATAATKPVVATPAPKPVKRASALPGPQGAGKPPAASKPVKAKAAKKPAASKPVGGAPTGTPTPKPVASKPVASAGATNVAATKPVEHKNIEKYLAGEKPGGAFRRQAERKAKEAATKPVKPAATQPVATPKAAAPAATKPVEVIKRTIPKAKKRTVGTPAAQNTSVASAAAPPKSAAPSSGGQSAATQPVKITKPQEGGPQKASGSQYGTRGISSERAGVTVPATSASKSFGVGRTRAATAAPPKKKFTKSISPHPSRDIRLKEGVDWDAHYSIGRINLRFSNVPVTRRMTAAQLNKAKAEEMKVARAYRRLRKTGLDKNRSADLAKKARSGDHAARQGRVIGRQVAKEIKEGLLKKRAHPRKM